MNNTITAILFDFGGVLAEEGFHNGLQSLASEQQLLVDNMPEEGMRAVYDSGFVVGRGTAADFWALLRQRTGLQGEDNQLTQRILEGFVVRPAMMKLVGELNERGFLTGILSDQTDWLDMLDAQYQFYKNFNHIFNSYYLGKGKQDPTLFTDVAAYLNLSPAEILFIDDDEGNVARARACGYQGLHYISQDQFVTELEKMLS
jgi:putative hydrolase of the HAD superfamily